MNAQQLYLQRRAPALWTAIKNKNLWFVRSTEIYNPATKGHLVTFSREQYINMPDVLNKKEIFEIPERALFNQSINVLVTPFGIGNVWDCRRYIFVAPMLEFVGELVGGVPQDFLTIGSHIYTSESYLLVPNTDVEKVKRDFPNLKSTIVGYNYPTRIFDLEGVRCLDELSIQGGPGETTPREAVEQLFDRISKEKDVDIWRFPNQYVPGRGLRPEIHPSNSSNGVFAKRTKRNGTQISVFKLLEPFVSPFVADSHSLETICGKINMMKSSLRNKNRTTETGRFISDLTVHEKPCDEIGNDYYAFQIMYNLKSFKATELDETDKYSPWARTYLTALYDKSLNILCYLEVLHKYKTVHPENLDYINSYLFPIDKPNNKLADVLIRLVNSAQFLPLKNLIFQISEHIASQCFMELELNYMGTVYPDLHTRFNQKMDEIIVSLHTEVERIKRRNLDLNDPEVKRKHNRAIIKATTKLTGGRRKLRSTRRK
jgi:hypothetical protein